MHFIGTSFEKLERGLSSFTLEVISAVLKPEWIREAADNASQPTRRDRKLPGPFVVWLVLAMGLFRTLSIQNVLHRMGNLLGAAPLWKNADVPTSAATVEARDRLGFRALRALMRRLQDWLLHTHRDAMSWKGLLLLIMDGTNFKVPDSSENRRRFGLPGVNRGGRSAFPQMKALFIVSAKMRFVLRAWFSPYRRGELAMAMRAIDEIPTGALLVLDRAYLAWRFLLALRDRGHQFLVRVPKTVGSHRRLQQLGPGDYLLEVKIQPAVRRQIPNGPKTVLVREVVVRIRGKWYRYFTSLLNPARYTTRELVELYAQRWEIETGFDEIKTHQCAATTVNRPVVFRSQSSRRVLQEAFGLVVCYNVIRSLMTQAATVTGADSLRISFVDSVDRIRQAVSLMAVARTYELPRMFEDLLASIAHCRLPIRKRSNPREVCIKMSCYYKKWKSA